MTEWRRFVQDPVDRPFSWLWVGASTLIFTGLEVVMGSLVGPMLQGVFTSHMLRLRLEVGLMLGSFFLGGLLVGLVSPGRRLLEPGVGAGIAAALTLLIAVLSPDRFLRTSPGQLAAAVVISFGVGLFGAHLGERATGN